MKLEEQLREIREEVTLRGDMVMNASQKRRLALGVMNWINRQAPKALSWNDMTKAFDDWTRLNGDTIAAEFWSSASDNQVKILKREYCASINDSARFGIHAEKQIVLTKKQLVDTFGVLNYFVAIAEHGFEDNQESLKFHAKNASELATILRKVLS